MLFLAALLLASILAASIVLIRAVALGALGNKNEAVVPVPGLPMVPNPHFLLGHFRIFTNAAGFESNNRTLCLEHANADGLCTFWLFRRRVLSVTRPADVKRILTAVTNRRPFMGSRHGRRFLGRRSLTFLRGREWRYYRSAMHRAFTPSAMRGMRGAMTEVPRTLVKSLERRILEAEETRKSDDDNGDCDGGGGEAVGATVTMDVDPLLKMVTMDTFGRSALGLDFVCCANLAPSPVASAFDYLSEELLRRFRTFYLPTSHFYGLPTEANRRHRRARRLVRGILEESIRDRLRSREEGGGKCCSEDDLLSHLLRARADETLKTEGGGKNKNNGLDLSEETFSDILMTLLFAGYETNSITLTYALYCLANNPVAEDRVVEEVNRVLGPPPSSSSSEEGKGVIPAVDPETLPYCLAVILETLRLYPPAPNVTRTLECPLTVAGGYTVPADTQIFIPVWLIQRDERNFPRPLEFVPERWVCRDATSGDGGWRERCAHDAGEGIGTSRGGAGGECSCGETETTAGASPGGRDSTDSATISTTTTGCTCNIPPANREAFFAFSGGARSCVGRRFALQEAVIALAVLVRDLRFECVEGYVLEPHRHSVTQKPRGGMPMIISRRNVPNRHTRGRNM